MIPLPSAGRSVLGLGCDITEVSRIRGVIERQGAAFLERVFTPAERAYCDGMRYPEIYYAARFAAKEAVGKCLGTGITGEFAWTSLEVGHDEAGAPIAILDEKARALLQRKGASEVLLSLSHTEALAFAVAVLQ